MNKLIKELQGSWILFFHYLKWPFFLWLPSMYLFTKYKNNIIMDILWIYCAYLVIVNIINIVKNRGLKKCDKTRKNSKS